MILLIPLLGTSVEELKENLNSIMILLILESLNQYGERKQKFKFHYDSINSIFVSQHLTIMFHLNSIMILLIQMKKRRKNKCQQQFKFHYDSINSHSLRVYLMLRYQYLNSIMILLIQLATVIGMRIKVI